MDPLSGGMPIIPNNPIVTIEEITARQFNEIKSQVREPAGTSPIGVQSKALHEALAKSVKDFKELEANPAPELEKEFKELKEKIDTMISTGEIDSNIQKVINDAKAASLKNTK